MSIEARISALEKFADKISYQFYVQNGIKCDREKVPPGDHPLTGHGETLEAAKMDSLRKTWIAAGLSEESFQRALAHEQAQKT